MITIEQIQGIGHDLPPARTNPAPGFVCLYTAPEGEHCIVGEICQIAGLDVPRLNEADNQVAVGYLATDGRWAGRFEPKAAIWAAMAQVFGQLGYPWAVCVQVADNMISKDIQMGLAWRGGDLHEHEALSQQ